MSRIVKLPRYEVTVGNDGARWKDERFYFPVIQLGKLKLVVDQQGFGRKAADKLARRLKTMLLTANTVIAAREERLNSNILDEIDAECAQYEARGQGRDSRKLRRRLMARARREARS